MAEQICMQTFQKTFPFHIQWDLQSDTDKNIN